MNKRQFCACLISAVTTTCGLTGLTGQSAIASAVNEWDYAIDSFIDGYDGFNSISDRVGQNSSYEFYGLAFKEEGNNIIIALNANLPLTGDQLTPEQANLYKVPDGIISWGDLFFNFTGSDFKTANTNGSLYAIRFSETNNSGVPTLGVYKNVSAKSVTEFNSGLGSLNTYKTYVQDVGGIVNYAALPADTTYFDQTGSVSNVIDTGTFVTGINWLDSAQLGNLGLNFGQYGATGSQTIGFSLDRTAFNKGEFTGDFIASIFAECANDGMALHGKTEEIPEPLTILGSIAGIGYIWRRQRSKHQQTASADRT